MFFGSVPFGATSFADTGAAAANVTITVSGNSATITLSNTFTVQKVHHVNGNDLTATLNSVTPNLAPTIAGTSLTSATNTPTVTADANLTVTGTSCGCSHTSCYRL